MCHHRRHIIKGVLPLAASLLWMLALGPAAYADVSRERLAQLDELTYSLSDKFYQGYSPQGAQQMATISELERSVARHIKQANTVAAIDLIRRHIALITEHIDQPSSYIFLSLLLENNELVTASQLYDNIQRFGNTIIVANGRFAMAKYALKRGDWQQTLDYLQGIASNLPAQDSEHALLIEGFVLQKLKQHRQAIEVYERSTRSSHHYPVTANNLAAAYIRQDWWTDGHQVLQQLLRNNNSLSSEELNNRIHVTLGYSLLRKEYYRDAREAFRKVTLDSHYVNRALLGLALTAINQNDYVGALNAVSILKGKNSYQLPAEEAFLIQPYIYSKLQQQLTASAGFNEAIGHYQQRIDELEAILQQPDALARQLDTDRRAIIINQYRFDLSQDYPLSLLDNYHLLKQLAQQTSDSALTAQVEDAALQYHELLADIGQQFLRERISQLNSYIDQSRFGLALLFDNSQVE